MWGEGGKPILEEAVVIRSRKYLPGGGRRWVLFLLLVFEPYIHRLVIVLSMSVQNDSSVWMGRARLICVTTDFKRLPDGIPKV